jgi:hypothetical protein
MATIKAGTYRFNDEITLFSNDAEYSLEFTSVFIRYQGVDDPKTVKFDGIRFADNGNALMYSGKNDNNNVVRYYVYEKVSTTGLASGWVGIHHTITLIKEQTVNDAFYEWFTANAVQVVATINHEGCIISGIKSGQTATLKCAGMQMETDVVVAVAENIGGGCGECSGNHIIEVTELPTENIDENAVYLCGGAYYKYSKEFVDILLCIPSSEPTSINSEGLFLHYATTKPTENIAVTAPDTSVSHIYYIEDENDLFAYGDFEETGENEWHLFSEVFYYPVYGVVSDASEIDTTVLTVTGIYAVINTCWTKYLAPIGTLTITENGTYDVSGYANVVIEIG